MSFLAVHLQPGHRAWPDYGGPQRLGAAPPPARARGLLLQPHKHPLSAGCEGNRCRCFLGGCAPRRPGTDALRQARHALKIF